MASVRRCFVDASPIAVGVVGAGAMGAGIAQVAAAAGHSVLIFDVRQGAAADALRAISDSLDKLVAKGKVTTEGAQAICSRLREADSIAGLAPCGLVIEAIVEELAGKQELFTQLESVVAEDALLATNTSSLSVTAIAAQLQNPGRFAGMHFFNPAPVMPLVEIVSGASTSKATAATLHTMALSWGKVPVYARSSPGFIVNRVARPFYAEALRVLDEGAADCATVDAVMRESGGFRMGPFELMDLIGNDVNYAVTRSVFESFYGDPRFTPSLRQLELVHAGKLGRKTGEGFFDYRRGAPSAAPETMPPTPPPSVVTLYGECPLVERLAAANVSCERVAVHLDGRLAVADGCTIFATDGRTATQRAASGGLGNAVLVDLMLDPWQARRVAISAADQCDSSALAAAAGLLQAAGIAVSGIGDVPGMIVMRTVAMLANEAADAVNQGVCNAEDCDLAMQKGVNYPRGPLAWAQHIGLRKVVNVLDHMQHAYGEDRYRVSPLLRRKALAGGHFLTLTEKG